LDQEDTKSEEDENIPTFEDFMSPNEKKRYKRGAIFTWPSWAVYTGQFQNNMIQGVGECVWPSLDEFYVGDWKNWERHGKIGKQYYALYKKHVPGSGSHSSETEE